MNPLRDDEIIRGLLSLREKDPDAFMKMAVSLLRSYPDVVQEDEAPTEEKTRALSRMLSYLENIESYEDCAFILELKKKLEDGGKE